MDIKTGFGLLLPVARNVLGFDSARETLGAFTEQLGDMDLTILFTDIDDYTTLIDRLGDARAQHLVRVHNAIVRKTLRDAGGIEVKHTGDGILACFLSASCALECACAIQAEVAAYSSTNPGTAFRVAIGLNTGDPIHEEGDIYGTAVITASRVADLAAGGQILVTDVVRLLCAGKSFRFASLGERKLEGLAEPCNVYEVDWQPPQPLVIAAGRAPRANGPSTSSPTAAHLLMTHRWGTHP